MQRLKVLIVEDEWVVSEELKVIIQNFNCEVIGQADNAKDAIAILDQILPHLVITDLKLQGSIDGIDLGRLIKQRYPCQLILLTSFSDPATLKRAKEITSIEILPKPFEVLDIHRVLTKYRSRMIKK